MALPVSHFNRPLVLSGPSGSGKSTLLKQLQEDHPNKFGFSVSHTTRQPRAGEVDGVHYHFVTQEDFERLVKEGAFIEHAKYSSNRYGTTYAAVQKLQDEGKRVIFDIDSQGVQSLKKTSLDPFYLYITPASSNDLRSRLEGRKTETQDTINQRLAAASKEFQYAKGGNFDAVLVNDDLKRAYSVFEGIALGTSTRGDPLPDFV